MAVHIIEVKPDSWPDVGSSAWRLTPEFLVPLASAVMATLLFPLP